MKFKIICYHTITHREVKRIVTKEFQEALKLFNEEVSKEEAFIDVRLYKGFIKITSCFMGNGYYKELRMLLDNLKENKEEI